MISRLGSGQVGWEIRLRIRSICTATRKTIYTAASKSLRTLPPCSATIILSIIMSNNTFRLRIRTCLTTKNLETTNIIIILTRKLLEESKEATSESCLMLMRAKVAWRRVEEEGRTQPKEIITSIKVRPPPARKS